MNVSGFCYNNGVLYNIHNFLELVWIYLIKFKFSHNYTVYTLSSKFNYIILKIFISNLEVTPSPLLSHNLFRSITKTLPRVSPLKLSLNLLLLHVFEPAIVDHFLTFHCFQTVLNQLQSNRWPSTVHLGATRFVYIGHLVNRPNI